MDTIFSSSLYSAYCRKTLCYKVYMVYILRYFETNCVLSKWTQRIILFSYKSEEINKCHILFCMCLYEYINVINSNISVWYLYVIYNLYLYTIKHTSNLYQHGDVYNKHGSVAPRQPQLSTRYSTMQIII